MSGFTPMKPLRPALIAFLAFASLPALAQWHRPSVTESDRDFAVDFLSESGVPGEYKWFESDFYLNNNSGWGGETTSVGLNKGMSLFTLARYLAEDDGKCPGDSARDVFVQVVKRILSAIDSPDPGQDFIRSHQPYLHGGLDMRHQSLSVYTLALLPSIPGCPELPGDTLLEQAFSEVERHRHRLLLEAAFVYGAFVRADFMPNGYPKGNNRVTIDGDKNTWFSGPNFEEGITGAFAVAGLHLQNHLGVDLKALINNFDFDSFVAELESAGMYAVSHPLRKLFTESNNSGITYHASTSQQKKDLVEGMLHSIESNDGSNRPFASGHTFDEIFGATGSVLRLHYAVAKRTFPDLRAEEGDFIGAVGQMKEFQTVDGSGTRDDLWYSASGLPGFLGFHYMLQHFGVLVPQDVGDADLDTMKADLVDRVRVGLSDMQSRFHTGYASRANGREFMTGEGLTEKSDLSQSVSNRFGMEWAQIALSSLSEMGYLRNTVYWQGFDTGFGLTALAVQGWFPWQGSWEQVLDETWTGSTSLEEYVYKSSLSDSNAFATATQIQGDYVLYCAAKVREWGGEESSAGLIGRRIDNSNYITMRYINSAEPKVQIVRTVNGAETVLTEAPAPFNWTATTEAGSGAPSEPSPPEHVIQLRGTFDGSLLSFRVDYRNDSGLWDRLEIHASDHALQGGRVGVYSNLASVLFDDILITETIYRSVLSTSLDLQIFDSSSDDDDVVSIQYESSASGYFKHCVYISNDLESWYFLDESEANRTSSLLTADPPTLLNTVPISLDELAFSEFVPLDRVFVRVGFIVP